MTSKEEEAVYNLANLEDDDSDLHFEPYSSAAFSTTTTTIKKKLNKRPQTVDNKKHRTATTETSFRKDNHRQELKQQLKVLE